MEITAQMVKALRDKTSLPMMDCKKALAEAGGDEAAAIHILDKKGAVRRQKMSDRVAAEGRVACFIDADKQRGGMVELRCETSPVASTDEFIALAQTIARQAAATDDPSPDVLRDQALLDDSSRKLCDKVDDVFNRLRENIQLSRAASLSGHVAYYVHHNGQVGVLVEFSGPCPDEVKQDMCMHVTALNPSFTRREQVDASEVEKKREIFQGEAQGKPEAVIDKIVTGKLGRWFSEFVLLEQPFVKDDKKSVSQVLMGVSADLTIKRFVRFEVGGG